MSTSKAVILISTLFTALCALAEASISDVVVNQRWPWNEKVDVDFVLSGETNDVEVTATWDTHSDPFWLGTVFAAVPGHNRFTWNPSKSPVAGQTLTGFTVALKTVALTNSVVFAHAYLVIDLVNGGYEFRAAPPASGWTDEYKSSKMAFRRIRAGTYVLGEDQATFEHLKHYSPGSVTTTNCNRREVTFTSDFYVGIYKYTEAQHLCLTTGSPGRSFIPQKLSYNDLRGTKSAGESNVDWPTTGYKVAVDSIVAKLRAKAGSDLVVDLCEEEQWEVAARAGKVSFWPTGGTTSEDFTSHTNQVNAFVSWYGTRADNSTVVGKEPLTDNGWGLYDVVGLAGEWTLDTAENSETHTYPDFGLPLKSVNPIGVSNCLYRILKSANGNGANTALYDLLPCRRQMAAPSSSNYSTRFCIHLKPLGTLAFEEN